MCLIGLGRFGWTSPASAVEVGLFNRLGLAYLLGRFALTSVIGLLLPGKLKHHDCTSTYLAIAQITNVWNFIDVPVSSSYLILSSSEHMMTRIPTRKVGDITQKVRN